MHYAQAIPMTNTGNETADFLIRQLRFLKRVGSPAQKQEAPKWERLIAEAAAEPLAVNFAEATQEAAR